MADMHSWAEIFAEGSSEIGADIMLMLSLWDQGSELNVQHSNI